MRKILISLAIAGISLYISTPAHAIPTFQTYIDGAVGTDMGSDEDTWFSTADPLTLVVVGAYGSRTVNLSDVTLVMTVPEGEVGTVSFTNVGDGTPILLTSAGFTNPNGDPDLDILTDVGGLDGYALKETFEPTGFNFPPHFPTGDGDGDFLLFSLGDFSNDESNLYNYNADDGTITQENNTSGEQREYQIAFTGFSSVHFDVYGYEEVSRGQNKWTMNPASHDATWNGTPDEPGGIEIIPEPGSLSLLGLGFIGLMRRRRSRA